MAAKATLRQVADRAGVAIGTASAVFAGKSWVSERVRAAVLASAEDLKYQPRARRQEPSQVTDLGFLSWADAAFSPANPYFAQVLQGAEQACAERGISLRYEVADPSATRLPQCVQQNQVSGLLVLSDASDRDYLRRIVDRRIPCVLVEHEQVDLPVDYVRHDDEHGGYLAARHLLSLARRPAMPGLITAQDVLAPAAARVRGFRRGLEEAGVAFDPAYVRHGTFDVPSGMRRMDELLDLPEPPTAVFCANDETALGALEAARARGLRVPEDVAIMGFDDIPQAAAAEPPLTTIATSKGLIGAQAVWHLLERLQRPGMASRDTRLSVQLVERASTAGG
ncbi:LacI family DNA-binding transcriptional regulator [Kitasatospora indigofera]|uniref:LacI family DNA-binding transcriptional regulator n=1 Tax=Kitasatospora indigofera TaxID=67307 RepID=UPI00365D2F5C